MQVTFVNHEWERQEYRKVVEAYGVFSCGKMSKREYDKLPRKEWIDIVGNDNGSRRFLVVDNRTGDCWVEEFDTLDGAVLYATDVYSTPPKIKGNFDFEGAVGVYGSLMPRIPQ